MYQKKLNKNITGTQKEDALENIMQQDRDKFLSYRFEVMEDDNIYSVSFDGRLSENESKKLLAALRNCLYENMADCIQKHMEQHNIAYSDFISSKIQLEHSKVMELTELLLHSDNCSSFDSYFGNADTCYVIADHQKWIAENCCHGCYFAVKRTLSESESLCKYNIIGQTFNYNQITDDESAYFAIRKNMNDELLYNIAVSKSEPVLPTFGCVDIMNILLDIDNIKTAERTIQIAVK